MLVRVTLAIGFVLNLVFYIFDFETSQGGGAADSSGSPEVCHSTGLLTETTICIRPL